MDEKNKSFLKMRRPLAIFFSPSFHFHIRDDFANLEPRGERGVYIVLVMTDAREQRHVGILNVNISNIRSNHKILCSVFAVSKFRGR